MNITPNALLIKRLDIASHKKIYPSVSPKKESSLRRILLITRLWNDIRSHQMFSDCNDSPSNAPIATPPPENTCVAPMEEDTTGYGELSTTGFDWSWLDEFGSYDAPELPSSTVPQEEPSTHASPDSISLLSHTPSENLKEDELASLMLIINSNGFEESNVSQETVPIPDPPAPQQRNKRGRDAVDVPESSDDGSDKAFPTRRVRRRNFPETSEEASSSPAGPASPPPTPSKPVMLSA